MSSLNNKNNKLCPFVKNPYTYCYCFNMTSKDINSAIHYCGNNFERCEIYKNNFSNQNGSHLKKENSTTNF